MRDRYRVQAAAESWSGRGLALSCTTCRKIVTTDLPAQVSLRRLEEAADAHEWGHHSTEALLADVFEILTHESREPVARIRVPAA